tara:strand:- start:307776 stop:310415 length:2640 start_codon:yes stop_codon:yes gene_type:complete
LKKLPKQYDPKEVEKNWSKTWLDSAAFAASAQSQNEPYSIVIPPPNVTGILHIGHALNNTLQDILIRFKRMDGYNALWVPGTDHAGIATQNVVERQLMKKNIDRNELGREQFVEKVWEWKSEYGDAIVNQLKSLGASCDWDRERFTMDEGLSRAVREVFVSLHEDGLIYRGEYMINWCPRCHTALSDLEVEYADSDGHMWHIRYPMEDGPGELIIATTRPETMLGDTAVAVHPDDARYAGFIGKNVVLPLMDRSIPVIADEYVDISLGSGALKVTPAHDPNDFVLGEKHKLGMIKVIADDGTMTPAAGESFAGLDRYVARENVVKNLDKLGYLEKVEPHMHSVGTCYRCHTVVEPNVSNQWFVKVEPLAKEAIEAVEDGRIRFVPKQWENTYFDWMRNIRDWCISRQIWWGHRIPAWTCRECGDLMVLRDDPKKCVKCGSNELDQESDVLDTWFSSALWPFSTMGWPDNTQELRTFYPTTTLVTSFDIIFFWVARMIMMGLRFMGDVPFRDVYIHALVRDADGQKMSKSRGNTIDPLTVMSQYGSDSLRMTLTALAAQGRDIKLSAERIEGYRNFTNKLWNASRFALMNLEGFDFSDVKFDDNDLDLSDKWILSRLNRTISLVRESFDLYRFNDAANHLYHFIWREFCDWYLELIKPRLSGAEPGGDVARAVLTHTLEVILRTLSPIMPFITEEIWQRIKPKGGLICHAPYPTVDKGRIDEDIEREMNVIMATTVAIRNIRGEHAVKPSQLLNARIFSENEVLLQALERQLPFVNKLANVTATLIDSRDDRPKNCGSGVAGAVEVFVDLSGLADKSDRIAKIEKELAKAEQEIEMFRKKLSNKKFVNNAPPDVVEDNRKKLEGHTAIAEKLRNHLKQMA